MTMLIFLGVISAVIVWTFDNRKLLAAEISEKTEMEEEIETVDSEILERIPDDEELFAQYVQNVLYGEDETSMFSNYGETEGVLTASEREIYDYVKARILEIAENGGSTIIEIPRETVKGWNITIEDGESSINAITRTGIDTVKVANCLVADCPYDLYWFDKGTQGYGRRTGKIGDKLSYFAYVFYVIPEYQAESSTEDAPEAKAVGEIAKHARNKALAIANETEGESLYDRVTAYKDAICQLTSYNFEAITSDYLEATGYGDPWQLIYVFDEDDTTEVVCEGYAKAFQYLCDLSDIECYLVTGDMNGGGHMWNVIPLDGANYLVDVTNSDTGMIGQNGGLFLAGTEGSVDKGYIFHIQGVDVSYVYRDTTKNLYREEDLQLASSDYTAGDEKINLEEKMIQVPAAEKLIYDGTVHAVMVKTAAGELEENKDYTIVVKRDGNVVDEIRNAGNYEVTVTGKGSYQNIVTKTFTVEKAVLIPYIEGIAEKVYDGSDTVISPIKIRLDGVIGEDDVEAEAVFKYGTSDVGENLPVIASDISITGESAANYKLENSTVTAYTGIIQKKAVQTGWVKSDNKWYYYNTDGEKQTGWVKVSSKWYYMNSSGAMQTGWVKVSGKWYYMNSNGAMQTGWVKVSGKWYYMNNSGAMQTGWVKASNKWYYMNSSGVMQTGWVKVSGKWYYMNSSGVMQTGWVKISGKWYYFNTNGSMK